MMAEGVGQGRVTYHSPPPRRPKASRLGDMRRFVAPSPIVQTKIGPAEQLFLAFYVEVNGEQNDSTRSPDALEPLQIVRIGWVTGSAGVLRSYRQILVQPRGAILPSASELHGVTEAIARDEGAPIETVLNEFLTDVLEIGAERGRLLAHDLSFHGGVVERELARCSMTALQQHWRASLRQGLCLMDPDIGMWLLESHNHDCTQKPSSNALPMNQVLHLLLPEYIATPLRGHTAHENAAICLKIARALHEMTVPPCRRPGGRHIWKRIYNGAMRDNGEYHETCSECGHTL